MIRRIDLRGERRPESPEGYRTAVPRAEFDVEAAVPAVHAICEAELEHDVTTDLAPGACTCHRHQ